MGAGQFFRGVGNRIDDALVNQSEERAMDARLRAIEDIKADMQRNASDPAVVQQLAAHDGDYLAAATAERNGYSGWRTPVESINTAMNENPYARYGIPGVAAVGGGAAMTAGAQKLGQIMGLLQEADNTEVSRDMPLQS